MPEHRRAPDWFTRAIEAPAEPRYVEVDGTSIHYLSWNAGDTARPGLLFAHGFRAHARWWSFIAPFFLSRFHVVAMDFAGMGDSDARARYDLESFARDIVSVIGHARLGRTTLVGHSFGGSRVLQACADYPQHIERAIVIDSYIPLPELELRGPRPLQLRPKRVYPTFEAARERFRLVPEQNCAASWILDHVARHSLKQVEGGWTWKFDESFLPRHNDGDSARAAAVLERIDLPLTFIYGDRSIVVSRDHAHAIVRRMRHGHGPIAIPQSHHHVMLDQPLSLIAALRGLLY